MRNFARIGVLVLGIAVLGTPFGVQGIWAQSSVKCPPGKTAVEDFASGRVQCKGGDTLDTTTLQPKRRKPAAPGAPGAPGRPGSLQKPGRPGFASSDGAKSCGISRWGCQEACQRTYLASATGTTTGASQRAKVVLGSCLRFCKKKFACEPRPPKIP